MKKFLLLLMLFPSISFAICEERMAILAGGWSNHFIARGSGEPEWNEDHEGIIFECNKWSYGSFINSQGNEAIGIGKNLFINKYKTYDWSLYLGAWSGYDYGVTGKGIIPVGAFRFNMNYKALEVNTWLTPVVGVVTIGWEF